MSNSTTELATPMSVNDTTLNFINQTTLTLLNLTDTTSRIVVKDHPSPFGKCYTWEDAQHTVFQLANLCMAISFLTPSSFQYHVFFLRCLLLVGFVFFLLWAGLFVCMLDILVWNAIFVAVNLGHIGYLTYVNFPVKMHDQMEDIYSKLFRPLKMSRQEFALICKLGTMMTVPKGSIYAVEGITNIGDKVSILVKGKLKVTYGRFYLHHIEASEFVDSPECDSAVPYVETDEKYQVTISASEESRILTWHYPTLQEYLDKDTYLATAFHYILGKDISHKLYQIQELLLSNPDYMRTLASRQSSMVNLRNSLVTQDSCLSLTKLNNIHMSGGLTIASVGAALKAKKAERQDTIETSV
ncbi:blood vessel epicardial substance-like [Haliotis asinina]|uniref:blood vessel epicardial substance-like n=1 Tax=Haliotis asinina TaxID=109174 RepID=UPI0035317EC4